MFERFTERGRQVVIKAQDAARELRHDCIGTEHLLLGLIDEQEGMAAHVLAQFGMNAETRPVLVRAIHLLSPPHDAVPSGQLPFTSQAKTVFELARREALKLEHNYVGSEHILLALQLEPTGAHMLVTDLGNSWEDVRTEILHQLSTPKRESSKRRGSIATGTVTLGDIRVEDCHQFVAWADRFNQTHGPLDAQHPLLKMALHVGLALRKV